jgi:hypothetical protein
MTIDPLNEIRNILDAFEEKIARTQTIWEELRELNPDFEQVSSENWQEKYYRMWLHGTTEVYECNELERWLYGDPSNTEIASSLAQDAHDAWRDWYNFWTPLEIRRAIQGNNIDKEKAFLELIQMQDFLIKKITNFKCYIIFTNMSSPCI